MPLLNITDLFFLFLIAFQNLIIASAAYPLHLPHHLTIKCFNKNETK